MNKQITLTLDESAIKALHVLADKSFDGNLSMALRSFLRHNGLADIIEHEEKEHFPSNRNENCHFCNVGM